MSYYEPELQTYDTVVDAVETDILSPEEEYCIIETLTQCVKDGVTYEEILRIIDEVIEASNR